MDWCVERVGSHSGRLIRPKLHLIRDGMERPGGSLPMINRPLGHRLVRRICRYSLHRIWPILTWGGAMLLQFDRSNVHSGISTNGSLRSTKRRSRKSRSHKNTYPRRVGTARRLLDGVGGASGMGQDDRMSFNFLGINTLTSSPQVTKCQLISRARQHGSARGAVTPGPHRLISLCLRLHFEAQQPQSVCGHEYRCPRVSQNGDPKRGRTQ